MNPDYGSIYNIVWSGHESNWLLAGITREQKQVCGMCIKSLSDGPWHGFDLIRSRVPRTEAFTRQIKGMKMRNIVISSTVFACLSAYLIVDAKLHDCTKAFSKANAKQNEFYPGT